MPLPTAPPAHPREEKSEGAATGRVPAEPSDPGDGAPTAPHAAQEENPQLVAHRRGWQAADARGGPRSGARDKNAKARL